MTESTALTVQERASIALGLSDIDKTLVALAEQSKTITAITNNDGYEQCRSARIVLKNQRVAIQNKGKQARDDANAFSKAVIAEEKRLIGIIEPEESRLQVIEGAHESKLEAEKQAKIAAELKRVSDIQARIEKLKGDPSLTSLCSPDDIQKTINDINSTVIDSSFEEFKDQASVAKVEGIAKLNNLHNAAAARVAEEARIKAEREELAKLKAEQVERDRIAQQERDAEAAKQREAVRLQQLENERIAAEQRAAQQRIDDENARLKAEREEFERQKVAATVVPDPVPVLDTPVEPQPEVVQIIPESIPDVILSFRPSRAEIVTVVAEHFKVSNAVAHDWLVDEFEG